MQKLNRYDMQMLHFATLILTLYCYYADKKKDFFQITYSKKSKNMAVEQKLKGNNKLLSKTISFNYSME